MRKRKTTTRMTKMMTVSVIQSTKLQIAFILGSWLGLHFLLKVIPQILINVLLTVTFQLKNILVRTVSTIPVAYCIPMLVQLLLSRQLFLTKIQLHPFHTIHKSKRQNSLGLKSTLFRSSTLTSFVRIAKVISTSLLSYVLDLLNHFGTLDLLWSCLQLNKWLNLSSKIPVQYVVTYWSNN